MKQILWTITILFFSSRLFCQNTNTTFTIRHQGNQYRAEEILSKYIQQKSYSCEEKIAGNFIMSVCEENGLHITQFGSENENFNFTASLYPLSLGKPNVILLNHIDVVHEGDTLLWKYPAFSGFIGDSLVWGRGAFDNKGQAVMQLFSLLKLKNESMDTLPFNVSFLAVSCEEIMCERGIDYVLDNYLHELNPVTAIGEGAIELSEMIDFKGEEKIFGIAIGQKRPLWIQLDLHIKNLRHGSVTPEKYANQEMVIALTNLARTKKKVYFINENKAILRSLGSTKKGFSKFILRNPTFFKPMLSKKLKNQPELYALYSNSITITSIESNNDVINTIPQHVSAKLDCRLLPNYSEDKFLDELFKSLKNENIKIKIIKSMKVPPMSGTDNKFYSMLDTSLKITYPNAKVFPIILPNYNDISKFQLKGIESYSITPIILDIDFLHCIHAENERIPIAALLQGIEVYSNFLSQITQNYYKKIDN